MLEAVTFFVGIFLGVIGVFWMFGPIARTWGLAHMVGRPIIISPRSNRTLDINRVKKVDDMGRYHVKKSKRTLVYRIDPRHVYIAGRKVPATTVLEGFAMNVAPEYAKLAERREKGEKSPKLDIAGESIDWHALGRQVKEWLGPGHLASIMASAFQANKPVEPEKAMGRTALKIGGFAIIMIVIFVGIYLAKTMGWF